MGVDERDDAEDAGMQFFQGFGVTRVATPGKPRLPRRAHEARLERQDAVPLRTAKHGAQCLRRHFPHFQILVFKTLKNDIHHPRHRLFRKRGEIAVPKHSQGGQRIQAHSPTRRVDNRVRK